MGLEGIVFAILASNSLTIGLAGSAFAISAITGAVQIGLSVGLSYLSTVVFAPKQPRPEDVQSSVKNPTAPRQRHYGRVKTSGPWVFAESKSGSLHKVIALGTGELDAVEEVWIDNNLVTLDVDGEATSSPYSDGEGDNKSRILYRLGLATETHYSELESVFPEWDENHLGNGVSSLYALQRPVSADSISRIFPNLANTNYRVVARGSKVYNPATETTIWSESAADVIRDYMTHSDGMRLPESLFTTTGAATGWLAAHNRAAEQIDKKAGGTEDAYRLWGSYTFDERPADVLGRMLQCCDGRIVPTPDGGITLDIGTWAEPTVTLDEDAIVSFSEVGRGRDILTTANVIAATFLSPTHDYQATDADRWIDEEDVSARGEIVSELSFNMSPSHGQTRRLMKIAAYRAKPNWVGTFTCNLRGLAAFGERFVRITYPLFDIDEVFEVQDFRFDIGEGNILRTVTLAVQSMPQDAYDWDAATEEGTEPISEETTVDNTIPVPDAPTFGITRITISGQQVPYGVITYDPAPDGLTVEGRYKRTADTDWLVIAIDPDGTSAQFGALSDGDEYEAQIRYVTITGRQGDWSTSATLTPVADPTGPGNCTSLSATGGLGRATIGYTTPVASNLKDVVVAAVAVGGTPTDADIISSLTQLVPPATATAKSLTYGDATRTELIVSGDMATSGDWPTQVGGASVTGGKAVHTPGTAGSIRQSAAYLTAGKVYRYKFTIDSVSAGGVQVDFLGGTTVADTLYTTSGTKFDTITAVSGNNVVAIAWNTAGNAQVDNFSMIESTVDCAPAGAFDFYVKARNASGVGNWQLAGSNVTVV